MLFCVSVAVSYKMYKNYSNEQLIDKFVSEGDFVEYPAHGGYYKDSSSNTLRGTLGYDW